jgi:hypothetical protein
MACCGQRQSQLPLRGQLRSARTGVATQPSLVLWFEYTGSTAMTVFGPATARYYRFDRPGARLPLDARDVPFLKGIPHLRRARKS